MQVAAKPSTPAVPGLAGLVLGLILSMAWPSAWALCTVVGPDGKITYTDRAPANQPVQALKSNGAASATDGLPFELQRVAAKYPVTLYTTKTCAACDSGRQLLQARGIPYIEKTVITNDDIKAFSAIDSTGQVPVLRIGGKQLAGFNQPEWTSYLDAAGYPAKSMLPQNYRAPAPSPLVPLKEVSAPDTRAPSNRPVEPPPLDSGTNPAGIRF